MVLGGGLGVSEDPQVVSDGRPEEVSPVAEEGLAAVEAAAAGRKV